MKLVVLELNIMGKATRTITLDDVGPITKNPLLSQFAKRIHG